MKTILLIGSGPIVIGQGCEFDYSGSQAVKVLKQMGFRVILLNSNPATIMTDPELADATYIEPINLETLEKIIIQEKPDGLIPTLGGQTALNLAVQAAETGLLEKYSVSLLGASLDTIQKAEDREKFKQVVEFCGYEVCKGGFAKSIPDAIQIQQTIGKFPLILRPSFTLGGTGGSIAYTADEFIPLVQNALDASPVCEVLIEESIIGWKEFELEIMRDKMDNFLVVCTIENFDPMGIHTGDSITVAPAQTLTDKEYQKLRMAAKSISKEIGIQTGGANIQFAIDPKTGRMIVIEMNPRVSRSSALASKATGFPIAKIAAQVAVGKTLDEILNDITGKTPASFEPTIDYVVTKIPRFNFDKFPGSSDHLGIQMKAIGEVMAIGKTFKESLQKACQSMENGWTGIWGKKEWHPSTGNHPSKEEIHDKIYHPSFDRLIYLYHALAQNLFTPLELNAITQIDPWFLFQLEELKNEIVKSNGNLHLSCIYQKVDTCAAEFSAVTPYFYSTIGQLNEAVISNKKRVLIIGSGPNRIGQGIEFDYCCVHAIKGFRAEGYEVIMMNSNPETVSTDYDESDILLFEPITIQYVLHAIKHFQPEGVVLQFGGQTPLKLAKELEASGIKIFGTSVDKMDLAEDRSRFGELLHQLNIKTPNYTTAISKKDLPQQVQSLGYPVLIRPSYVLGGQGMRIVYSEHELTSIIANEKWLTDNDHLIFIDQYLIDAIEFDVDIISDGENVKIIGITQQVEETGIHSGDSTAIYPPYDMDSMELEFLRQETSRLTKAMKIVGLANLQWAKSGSDIYLLEMNPRASRTIPFLSKAKGLPFAKMAAQILAGKKLTDIWPEEDIVPSHFSVKGVVFPFNKLGSPGFLGPEMKSTGEVMGIGDTAGIALAKSYIACGYQLPKLGDTIYVTVHDAYKERIGNLVVFLSELGFKIASTTGTANYLESIGISCRRISKVDEGRPNILDEIANGNIQAVINIPGPTGTARSGVYQLHTAATRAKIPYVTTLTSANMFAVSIYAFQSEPLIIRPIQDYYRLMGASTQSES